MMSYHTLGLVRLIAHGVPPFRFRPATIVSVRDFWSPPVSHGAFQLARSSPRAINTKQKRDEDKPVVHFTHSLRTLLSSAITTYGSAEVALLQIMKTHDFSPSLLQWVLTEDRMNLSFSKVKYADIAPFVGLQPGLDMDDIETFDLHRSRIPTALFESIVQDIDVMIVQYGLPAHHRTKEARSRFLSPIFNRLIAIFGSVVRNRPESIIEGRITTEGRMEYLIKTIGSIAVLFIEMKLNIGSDKERLDAVAQVIAECVACDWNNAQLGFRLPVYGILCDGTAFEFFLFDGTTKPFSFKHGLSPNDPPTHLHPFQPSTLAPRLFIHTLRPICEIIFDLLLSGYVSSLKAHHSRFSDRGAREGQPSKGVYGWEEVASDAVSALQCFRYAEKLREVQLIDEANSRVEEAMTRLKRSVDAIPMLHKPRSIMTGWDDAVEHI